jgi:hypothetical protein
MKQANLRNVIVSSTLLTPLLATVHAPTAFAQQAPVTVRVDRWLSIQQFSGTVNYDRGNASRAARVGDRLESVGEGVTTGRTSFASLAVDTGVGLINVLEQTRLRVRELSSAPDNGRITRLDVLRGQVRLRLRPFTHRGSQLEIHTPAGVSGVRGTEFGVSVQPDGKTGVATLTGAVETSAQGAAVQVPAGFQNLTIPGEPPSTPTPLKDDPGLEYRFEKILERNIRRVRLVGQVDPVNMVFVNGQPQSTDRTGRFSSEFLAPSFLRVNVVVTTPLGRSESYELALR